MSPTRLLVLLALPLTACVGAEDDPAEESTSETTHAISSHWLVAFSSTPAATDTDIGSASAMTCFITGLKGTLGDTTAPYATAYARVQIVNGRWRVQTHPGAGPGISVQAGCISNTLGRVFFGYTENDDYVPSQYAIDASESAHCFITEVSGTGWGWMANLSNQPNSPPGVAINRSNGKVWMGMSVNENSNDVSAASATGVCVNIRGGTEFTFNATGPCPSAGMHPQLSARSPAASLPTGRASTDAKHPTS
jgi:hypothetical protein